MTSLETLAIGRRSNSVVPAGFFRLSCLGLTGISSFSVDTRQYEREMHDKGLPDISKMRRGDDLDGLARSFCASVSPVYTRRWEHGLSMDGLLRKRYPGLCSEFDERYLFFPSPCSMLVDDVDELESHILEAYQVSFAHYLLGMSRSMYGCFPHSCCIDSSLNVATSLLARGYHNASIASNRLSVHDYVLLPFVMSSGECGSIIIDPTSDQLWSGQDRVHTPRNSVQVVLGDRWEYRTDYRGNEDLYPCYVHHRSVKKEAWRRKRRFHMASTEVGSFFDAAFRDALPVGR